MLHHCQAGATPATQGRHLAGMLQQQRPELGQGLASGGPQRLALALALLARGEPPRIAGL